MSIFDEIVKKQNRKLDESQLEAINSNTNTIVSAGAGSGKTTVLSYRYLRLILDKKAKTDEILTLTFTKKAALEMYERIYNLLSLSKDYLYDGALEDFAKASISTQDSFSSQILKTACTTYGLSKDFIIDSSLNFRSEILIDKFLNDEKNAREVIFLSTLYSQEKLRSEFFYKVISYFNFTSVFNAEEKRIKELEYVKYCFKKTQDEVYSALEKMMELDYIEEVELNLNALNEDRIQDLTKIKSRKKSISENKVDYNDNFEKLKEYHKIIEDNNQEAGVFYDAIQKFLLLVIEDKRKSGVLNFDDVNYLALDILKNNKNIRSYFKKKFKYIMVDEFQDNNDLQRQILYYLAEKENEFNSEVLIDNLDENKLFFVGDEKQSIYLFRGADVSVFRSLENEIKQKGKLIHLSTNYRSQDGLIKHFNSCFFKIFNDKEDVLDAARFTKTMAGRKEGFKSKIKLALASSEKLTERDLDSKIAQSEYITSLIQDIVSGKKAEYFIDGKAPTFSDIAILYRSASIQGELEKKLKEKNIAYQAESTKDWMTSSILTDFYSLLQTIIYPDDKISFLSYLASPFVHLSEKALSLLSQREKISFETSAALDELDNEKLEEAEKFYNELKENIFSLELYEIVEKLWLDSGYSNYIIYSQEYKEMEEHYDYLFDYAVTAEESGENLVSFIESLRNLAFYADGDKDRRLLRYNSNAVKLMSIHKSKGLEFPIVILANITGGENTKQDSPKFGLLKNEVFVSYHDSIKKDLIDSVNKEKLRYEAKRLLYVALTRSERHLILTGVYKTKNDGSFYATLGYLFQDYQDSINLDLNDKDLDVFDDIEIQGKVRKEDFPILIDDEMKEFKIYTKTVAATSLEHYEAESVEELASLSIDNILLKYSAFDKFGTFVHHLLELSINNQDIKNEKITLLDNSDKVRDVAFMLVDNFFKSKLYNFIKDFDKKTEVHFYSYQEGVVVEGFIDLVVFTKDYNLIIDYKTDYYKAPLIHKNQLLTYLKAAQDIYKKPCYATISYLRDLDKLSEIWDENGDIINLV